MPETSYLTTGQSESPAVPAAEEARLIREFGFAGASFLLNRAGSIR
jgi:hypothetical protein